MVKYLWDQGTILMTAFVTQSGPATAAVTLNQFTATMYGRYMLLLMTLAFITGQVVYCGVACMRHRTDREHLALIKAHLVAQERMIDKMCSNNKCRLSLTEN